MLVSARLSSDKHPVWSIEPHTRAKHALLKGYLDAWFPALGSWQGRVIFFDGFAGPGVYADGEPGSPAIAITALLDHHHFKNMGSTEFVFFFNEQESKRHTELERVVSELQAARTPWPSNVKVQVSNDGFQSLARSILDGLGPGKLAPTFTFLDPFGYKDVPLTLVSEFVKFDRSELFIYFDFNSFNRFSTAGNVDNHFTATYGTDEYKNAPPDQTSGRKEFLRDLYKRQLEQVAGFQYVRFFEMVNSSGHTGNYMFFCTRSKKGLEKMKEVMWKVDPASGNRFTDINADQTALFEHAVDTEPLKAALKAKFAGQTVTIEALLDFVIVETDYAATHLKTKTLKPMQIAGQISSPNQSKKNTYPPGTRIKFEAM